MAGQIFYFYSFAWLRVRGERERGGEGWLMRCKKCATSIKRQKTLTTESNTDKLGREGAVHGSAATKVKIKLAFFLHSPEKVALFLSLSLIPIRIRIRIA